MLPTVVAKPKPRRDCDWDWETTMGDARVVGSPDEVDEFSSSLSLSSRDDDACPGSGEGGEGEVGRSGRGVGYGKQRSEGGPHAVPQKKLRKK